MAVKNVLEVDAIFCKHDVFLPGVGKITREVYRDILFNYVSYVNIKQWCLTKSENEMFKFRKSLRIIDQGCDSTITVQTRDCKNEYVIGKWSY